jgi:hypothetical protein
VEFADVNPSPKGPPMTKPGMSLAELLERHDEGDFLRAIAETVLQLIMETDVEGVIGAGRHERAEGRTTWRNGYRDRSLDTRLGTPDLRVPKLRQGSCFPGFLEPRRTSEKASVAVIQGEPARRHRSETAGERDRGRVHAQGRRAGAGHGSIGDLQEHRLQALQGHRRARGRVPEPSADRRPALRPAGRDLPRGPAGRAPFGPCPARFRPLDEIVRASPDRLPSVSVAAMIAVAANADGRREIIGSGAGPSEAETFRTGFPRGLKARGPAGVKRVISDAHTGPKAAIARVFEGEAIAERAEAPRSLDEKRARVRHCARTNGAAMAHSRAAGTPWSPPRSGRRSASPTASRRGPRGATSPIGSGRAGRSAPRSWTRASTTCSPAWPSPPGTGPSCTAPTRSSG